MPLDSPQLTAWVRDWAETYPLDHDELLHPLEENKYLDRAGWETVVRWKFGSGDTRRLRNAQHHIAAVSDAVLEDVSAAAAVGCRDDDYAMRLIRTMPGVGSGLGSAALMALAPKRFTVLDGRALASTRALGFDLPRGPQRPATWLPYLAACREISAATELPLRTVDRALYCANGALET